MKKRFVLALLLIITTISFSQTTTSPSLTKSDYLQKSKKQKKVANIFLAGGAGCVLTAYLIPRGEKTMVPTGGSIWGIPIESASYKNDEIKGALFLTGTLSMLVSIPISLGAHRNKKKGMRLSFKNESTPTLQQGSFVSQAVPSLTLKIIL